MDRLEEQLRSLLTDERLDVRLAPGAVQAVHDGVRRRKRRNAALSAAASFALVIGGITAAVAVTQGGRDVVAPGQHNPTPTTPPSKPDTPPPSVQGAGTAIPWNPIAYDPSKPFALAGTTPDPSVPWCDTKQLAVTAGGFQGATGSAAGGLTLTNNGDTCGVQGTPVLTGYGDNDKVVATAMPGDAFLVHPWLALQHGQHVTTSVQIFGDAAKCSLGPVKRLTVDLGHGSVATSVDLSWVDGGDVKPRCGTVAPDQQLDHYTVSSMDWTRRDGTPRLPMADFSATVGQQPATAMQGTTIRYQVLLSTRGASVDPCLPFREQLVALDGTQAAAGTSYFLLDCAAMADASAQGYVLDMELAVPKDLAVGDYTLQWQTPIPGLGADESQTIRVTAAPPSCALDQLSLTTGRSGAATTHYSQDIRIRNSSDRACSLRGFPGIQFVGSDGKDLPTKDHWAAKAFMWAYDGYETVRLQPGATASFALGGIDYDVVHNQSCPTATGVKVIPPGLARQVLVHLNWPYCLGGKVDVSPVVGGSAAPR